MHEPADVRGQLLRLRARQHHAEIQRMQEALFRDPALSFDEFLMHERNLARRTAEAHEAEPQPVQERRRKRDLRDVVFH